MKKSRLILLCAILFIFSANIFATEILPGDEYIKQLKTFRHSNNLLSLYQDPKTGTGFVEVRGKVLNLFEFGRDKYFTLHIENEKNSNPVSYIYINLPENLDFEDIEGQEIACLLKWDIITMNRQIVQAAPLNRDDHYNMEFMAFLPGVKAIEAEIKSNPKIKQYGKPAGFVMPQALYTDKEKAGAQKQNISGGKAKIYSIIKNSNPDLSENITMAYTDYIITYSLGHGVDPLLTCAIIATESHFKNSSISKAGAKGLGQLMPVTCKGLGINNPFDPEQNIFGTTKYIKNAASSLFKKKAAELNYSQLKIVVASYNAGLNAVKKYKGIPPYNETKNYVVKVLNKYMKYISM